MNLMPSMLFSCPMTASVEEIIPQVLGNSRYVSAKMMRRKPVQVQDDEKEEVGMIALTKR